MKYLKLALKTIIIGIIFLGVLQVYFNDKLVSKVETKYKNSIYGIDCKPFYVVISYNQNGVIIDSTIIESKK